MANNREEKNPFGTDPQQASRAPQQVYDQLHALYYNTDSDEEEQEGGEHTHALRQPIYPSPPWEYAGVGNTNTEVRRYPNLAPNLLSPYDDSDDSDESYYEADDVEPFTRGHEFMGRQEAEKITIPDVDVLSLIDRVEESDLEQAIKLSLEEFNAKEKMEKIKLEQEKKLQDEERIREEIVKNYEGLLLQQKEKKPTTTKLEEGVVDSDVAEYQFFCDNPPEDSEEEGEESSEEVYYSD